MQFPTELRGVWMHQKRPPQKNTLPETNRHSTWKKAGPQKETHLLTLAFQVRTVSLPEGIVKRPTYQTSGHSPPPLLPGFASFGYTDFGILGKFWRIIPPGILERNPSLTPPNSKKETIDTKSNVLEHVSPTSKMWPPQLFKVSHWLTLCFFLCRTPTETEGQRWHGLLTHPLLLATFNFDLQKPTL